MLASCSRNVHWDLGICHEGSCKIDRDVWTRFEGHRRLLFTSTVSNHSAFFGLGSGFLCGWSFFFHRLWLFVIFFVIFSLQQGKSGLELNQSSCPRQTDFSEAEEIHCCILSRIFARPLLRYHQWVVLDKICCEILEGRGGDGEVGGMVGAMGGGGVAVEMGDSHGLSGAVPLNKPTSYSHHI